MVTFSLLCLYIKICTLLVSSPKKWSRNPHKNDVLSVPSPKKNEVGTIKNEGWCWDRVGGMWALWGGKEWRNDKVVCNLFQGGWYFLKIKEKKEHIIPHWNYLEKNWQSGLHHNLPAGPTFHFFFHCRENQPFSLKKESFIQVELKKKYS